MFAVVDWPSNLGLRPSGVEALPSALRRAGLLERLHARDAGRVDPTAPYDATRDAETGVLNGPALRDSLRLLAQTIARVIESGDIPIVLAGDCSVILGGLLGARIATRERVGLLFIDGHVDFYEPEASPTGEVADMDLAIATGRGPAILTELHDDPPLVHDEDVVAVGARDASEREKAGSQDIRETAIKLFELDDVHQAELPVRPFWCHLDADVLDDAVMPAVDYRQEGGMTPAELIALLKRAANSGRMIGVSVAIYNPALDPNGDGARLLVEIFGALSNPPA